MRDFGIYELALGQQYVVLPLRDQRRLIFRPCLLVLSKQIAYKLLGNFLLVFEDVGLICS
jgi:hypothetical protein